MIFIKYLIVVFCFFLFHIVSAQNEANNWYFGYNAGITFSNGDPVPLLDGQINTFEGCSVISDTAGSLLFYSDGLNVWNKNHEVMPNGTVLLGDFSNTNSGFIVPLPGLSTIFYLFTLDEKGFDNGLHYSIVDLSLAGGNGGITSVKNIRLEDSVTEKMSAIKVKDEDAYWVVAHRYNSDEL